MTFNSDSVKTHLEQVREWLAKNVVVPPTPKQVTVSSIRFDWKRLSGTFVLALDNLVFQEPFDVRMDITGRPTFTPPMFTSPLGAPASYPAIRIDQNTEKAVIAALVQAFPKVRAYGLHKDLDLIIDGFSPFEERIIDPVEFKKKCAALPKAVVTVDIG